ncbi:galactose ABC transporter substrate-binding protein [Candidatus Epulonipiscium viviparus]|uniref:galactose ABC transporter substrate-binding protein n=1 Tax=Candidatus Epulonipiscium viviparus TaxID=420336 RepID=UPI0027380F9E|nr:galactose ABC transporter substrate-binding protein [Candidatus Epulopiscium viviparus]
MKKSKFLLALTTIVAASFVGCSAAGGPMLEHFVYNFSDPQQNAVMNAIGDLYETSGVAYNFNDSEGKQNVQNDQIDNAIQKGATILVVGMADISSSQTVVNKAKNADIPILFYNQQPHKDAIDSYQNCWFVGSDSRGGGLMQGEIAATTILKDYDKYDKNGNGTIEYVMIRSDLSHPEANGRTEASVTRTNELFTAAGKPNIVQLGTDFLADDWSTNKGKDAMDTFLAANPVTDKSGVELVFCNNDGIAIGAMKSLQAVGWNNDASKAIPIIGVDATAEAQTYIDAGQMLASAGQDPNTIATYVSTLAFNIMNGKEPLAGTNYTFEPNSKNLFFPYTPYPANILD